MRCPRRVLDDAPCLRDQDTVAAGGHRGDVVRDHQQPDPARSRFSNPSTCARIDTSSAETVLRIDQDHQRGLHPVAQIARKQADAEDAPQHAADQRDAERGAQAMHCA